MREDIQFDADGTTLRGWFYRPDDADGEVPCIVMTHGFSAVKEMHIDEYAEVFCNAGLACVVYDHPGFGASDAAPGRPRQEIDPWEQIRGYQHGITYAQMRPEVGGPQTALLDDLLQRRDERLPDRVVEVVALLDDQVDRLAF